MWLWAEATACGREADHQHSKQRYDQGAPRDNSGHMVPSSTKRRILCLLCPVSHECRHRGFSGNTMKEGDARGSPEEEKDSPCAAALRVLLWERGGNQRNNSSDRGGGWLTSTKELRLVSLDLCNTCRSTLPLRVWVGQDTPRSLWGSGPRQHQHTFSTPAVYGFTGTSTSSDTSSTSSNTSSTSSTSSTTSSKRSTPVPAPPTRPRRRRLADVRATTVVWDRRARDVSSARFFLQDVEHLKFGFHFNEPLVPRRSDLYGWPQNLVTLDLGVRFQYDVCGVSFPSGLLELRFGAAFNRCIRRVGWPSSLRRLSFGASFNKPIIGVQFPTALRHLEFGDNFDQPLSIQDPDTSAVVTVSWPPILESLTFGAGFSQDVGGSSGGTLPTATLAEAKDRGHDSDHCGRRQWLPSTLKRLTLSEGFRQPLDTVAWPQGLEELNLDCVFVSADRGEQRSTAAVLPGGLKTLKLDLNFHQPIRDVMPRLPGTLRELVLGDNFNQPIAGLRWPLSLEKLSFGASFNQPIANDNVRFPPELQELSFGLRFNRPIAAVRFPPSLRRLTFRDHFNQPVVAVRWPEALRELRFGRTFDQEFSDGDRRALWPRGLFKMALGKNFCQPVRGLGFPPGLVELELGQGCKQELEGVKWPAGLRTITVDRGWRGGVKVSFDRGALGLPEGCRFLRR